VRLPQCQPLHITGACAGAVTLRVVRIVGIVQGEHTCGILVCRSHHAGQGVVRCC
jgi:hypothetical protein